MSRRLALLLPAAVLLAGLAASALGAWSLHLRTQAEAEAEFHRIVVRDADEIRDRFRKPVHGLNGARGVYATHPEVRRASFRRYVAALNLPVEFPGVRGFGFIQRVERADLDAYIAAERADDAPSFALRQLALKDEPDLFVIKIIEPAAANAGAAGLDIGSEAVRRQGAMLALRTGEATTTGVVTLVQDQRRSPGVLLYVPLYADPPHGAAPDTRGALRGLLYAPIVISELLADLGGVVAGRVHVELFDTARGTVEGPLMFDSDATASPRHHGTLPPAARFERLRMVDVPGRQLTLRVRSTPAFEGAYASTTAWLFGLGGLLASGMLAALMHRQIASRSRAERLARERTVDLANQKLALDQHAIVSITDLQGTIVYVNQRFCDLSGYSRDELIGQNHRIISSGHHERAFFDELWSTISSGEVWHGQICNRHKGGGHHWVDATVVPLLGADGLAEQYIAIRTDITERKRVEAALRANQALLSQTGRIGGVGGWELDVATQALSWTEETCRIHDLPPGHRPTLAEAVGYYTPDSRRLIEQAVAAGMASGRRWDLEVSIITASGRPIWVRAVGEAEFADGKPVRLVGAFQDITARRALEAELRAKNELVNSVIESLPCGLSVFDGELKLVAANREFRRLLGFPDALLDAPDLTFEDIIRFNAQRGEYGNELGAEAIEQKVRSIVERARRPVQLHQFDRERPNGTPLEIRGAPMPGGGFVTTYTDVSARKAAEAEVQRSASLLRGAIDAIDEAFVLYDPDDRLVLCNDKYRQIYPGVAHLMVPGVRFEDLVRAGAEAGDYVDAIGRVDAWVAERVAAHRSGDTTLVQKHSNGRTLRIVERKMADGHIVGFRIDVTELARATEAAEKASLAKSQFLANMSHEIRTPMNAILGMLTLLRRTELNPRQADYANKTEGAARSLLGLLNDILDFSKIEAGKMTLDPHPFHVDHLVRDLGVVLSANVGAKPVELLFDIDRTLPRMLVGDAMRLQQVLINLGGNAIKFTAEGEVVLSVRVLQRHADAVTLRVAVRDTGIGIAPENQARIFSGFTQAEASTTRRFGGTGLGVAISQRLVAVMGGELTLDSTLGQGSTFHFTLTLPVAEDGEAPAESPPTGLRALVVDDNPTARELLGHMIDSLGWQVELAASGVEALTMLAACETADKRYDVVFMDWRMPGLDGWETTKRIRESGLVEGAPVVVMVTAHGREKLEQRSSADQTTLDAYLVKPVTASMLLDAVVSARQQRDLPHRSLWRPLATAGGARRLSGLRLLLTEDNLNNQQVARELLEDEGATVHIAHNGQEGVEAVAAADPPFDIVLMDLQMPVMDGFTATARIRQDLGRTTLPIVAMTANAMASDREACLAAGMNEHIGKPFDIDRLVALLRRLAGRTAAALPEAGAPAAALPRALPVAVQAAADAAGVELAPALQRMGGKPAVYARMLRTTLQDFGSLAHTLQQPLVDGDVAEAERSLHTLKGLAATLGITALAQAAAAAEIRVSAGLPAALAQPICAAVGAALAAALPALTELTERLRENEVGPAAPPTTATPGQPDDHAALHQQLMQLATLLEHSDMRATELTPALRPLAGKRLGPLWDQLDEAVGSLDFEGASSLCRQLLQDTPACR